MTLERVRQGVQQDMARGNAILLFPPLEITPQPPRCLWCCEPFTRAKPNQVYCKRKHSQYACERRKDMLIVALADLLQRYGAKPSTATLKATEVVEANFRSGRIQRIMQTLGYQYDELARTWKLGGNGHREEQS